MITVGRLGIDTLWDFVLRSLATRDVIILTLIPSSSNANDNESYTKYVDTLDEFKRVAAISKMSNSPLIRDMYILSADTKDCPETVLRSLNLPLQFESKQLFLVVVGSGKKGKVSNNRCNEHQSVKNIVYNPIPLEDTTLVRDPRLSKMKNPKSQKNYTTMNDNGTLSTFGLDNHREQITVQS